MYRYRYRYTSLKYSELVLIYPFFEVLCIGVDLQKIEYLAHLWVKLGIFLWARGYILRENLEVLD